MHEELSNVADHSSATQLPANQICDADPPFRYLEMQNAARDLGSGTAAILALRTPGMLGIVKYMAARGDSVRSVCECLNLRYSDLQQMLDREVDSSKPR